MKSMVVGKACIPKGVLTIYPNCYGKEGERELRFAWLTNVVLWTQKGKGIPTRKAFWSTSNQLSQCVCIRYHVFG